MLSEQQVDTFNKDLKDPSLGTVKFCEVLLTPLVVMYFSAPTLLSLSSAAGSEREMNFAILMTAFG